MASKQVILTTVFGPKAEDLSSTFGSFQKVPDAELHIFVYNPALPVNRLPGVQYHLVEPEAAFVSIRRDALFRRWTLPDQLGAEFALVVDALDAVCIQPLPPFETLLRGASVAGAPEWGAAKRIPGQGYTGAYINAGVTFWHLPSSRDMRQEIVARGRACYRGPFDDQTALNEVVHTLYYDRLAVLPSQYNWRAGFRKSWRNYRNYFLAWPRLDSLDGVCIYHNQVCVAEVVEALRHGTPARHASLPPLPVDQRPLSRRTMFWRRVVHRWRHA